MDSRLLNALHDDPFDDNYVQYNAWSSDSDTMGLQLTETLHGILPITATDDVTQIYDNTIVLDQRGEPFHSSVSTMTHKRLNCNEYARQEAVADFGLIEVDNYQLMSEETDTDDDELAHVQQLHLLDNNSQCSSSTFRTRTDSSSIGDYESHTSDYEDDLVAFNADVISMAEDIEVSQTPNGSNFYILTDRLNNSRNSDLIGSIKERTISVNTTCSDLDGLGLGIKFDTNNFDLADFITQDDFEEKVAAKQTTTTTVVAAAAAAPPQIRTAQKSLKLLAATQQAESLDSDADSDVIVDVETVELDEAAEVDEKPLWLKSESFAVVEAQQPTAEMQEAADVAYVDNIKSDPSWSPQQLKKPDVKENKNKAAQQELRKPTKRQRTISKGKTTKRSKSNAMQNCKKNNNKTAPKSTAAPMLLNIKKEPVLEQQAAALEQQISSIQIKSEDMQYASKAIKKEAAEEAAQLPQQMPIKRTLNLEEYKKRRGEDNAAKTQNKQTTTIVIKTENATKVAATKSSQGTTTTTTKMVAVASPTKRSSDAVVAVVKSLKEQQQLKQAPVDPITEAKNKVLRMIEMQKAKQIKIIDSAVAAKVPRVTKILPLKEIIKDTCYNAAVASDDAAESSTQHTAMQKMCKTQPDFEEIIIISVASNTDITIAPQANASTVNEADTKLQQNVDACRSLLKSNVLLHRISNGLQKVQSAENVKISNHSLITSIQDVVVSQTKPVIGQQLKHVDKQTTLHGENKIIMHLRRDRMRQPTATIATQTDIQSEFPILKRWKRAGAPKYLRKRKTTQSASSSMSSTSASSSSSSSSSSSTSDSDSDSSNSASNCKSRRAWRREHNKNNARSASASSQSDYSEHERERSSSRCYSRNSSAYAQHNNNNRKFTDRNAVQPDVEERRIVYVGHIEEETTKEMLRRKFLRYGAIKQVTVHYKENGMKYGFVTYERSQDAFQVIDTSAKDASINMYDISFGGRRAFCRASYADLDNAGINTYQSFVFPKAAAAVKEEDSFEALLKSMKEKLNANKANASANAENATAAPTTTATSN